MGYSHKWDFNKPLTGMQFRAIKTDVKHIERFVEGTVCETAGGAYPDKVVNLYSGAGIEKGVLMRDTWLSFNGKSKDDLAAESMGIEVGDVALRSCKTYRKPYDVAVCLTLISIKQHVGDDVTITTDGTRQDWLPALLIYRKMYPNRKMLGLKDIINWKRAN